ncbi:hypothetical protein G6N82_04285 [Altererythrobacter sp. BO-6]|uniref:hypothetical protein n=1 Tax=Altererythrobacter sp. BO-6 TaxID=2604537 RepID=UPI0013E11CE8|nr:hypothetical protein [Altererythrobacter sp. BO-6]QIG53469.1 hypothetical protein G6N82_04285 [Altererythrobacter sp. BO-6]
MSWASAVVLIVLITAIAGVMRSRHRGGRRLRDGEQGQSHLPSAREQQLEREVDDLRERIKVLERIATEGNTIEARETRRIAEEIESLRDQQGQHGN